MMDLDDETEWIKAFSEKIDALKLPGNALDMLIDDLGGFNKIAEMSGRSERLVRNYKGEFYTQKRSCLLYTSPSPRDRQKSRMPSSA